jgi:septal ring factor EnvC (AmiA/AmiB activator)
MTEVTNEIIFEVLKKIQADVAHIKGRVDDHDQQFIALREQLHGLQGDLLRIDRQAASVSHRLERIERRLELTEA